MRGFFVLKYNRLLNIFFILDSSNSSVLIEYYNFIEQHKTTLHMIFNIKKASLLLAWCLLLAFNLQAQLVTTLAGNPLISASVDGQGTSANFGNPYGVVVDGGNLYVADYRNNEIRKIVIATGMVTTVFGNTIADSTNAIGTAAGFNQPCGIASDGSGNLYVADAGNNEIRKLVISTGAVTTLAGCSRVGNTNGTGTIARFGGPSGLVYDGSGNLYVADSYNNEIRKVVIATGVVTTIAGSKTAGSTNGTGTAARFNFPIGVAVDGSGNLYVADANNNEIRKITVPGAVVTTIAGTTTSGYLDAIGTAAAFNYPIGVATDLFGDLYIVEQQNSTVRKFVLSSNVVTTLAGDTISDTVNGFGTAARFNQPNGIATDAAGNIYIGDGGNNEIRKITFSTPIAYFKADTTVICKGDTLHFTDTSYNAPTSWKWTFQNGTPSTSTLQNPSVVYNTAGKDSVKLVVSNVAGKDSIAKKLYITVNAVPTLSISGDSSLCRGIDLLTAIATGNSPFKYSWSTGGTNDTIKLNAANTYSLNINDANGCKAKGVFKVKRDTITGFSICVVTVDTASLHNVIVWDKSGLTRIDSFKLYFYNSANKWQLIKEVSFYAPNYLVDSTPINDPNANTVRYCLTAVDSCGFEEPIGSSPWQNTCHINQAPAGTFTWGSTGYLKQGVTQPVFTYYLLRDSISNGNWKVIDSVSGTQSFMADAAYKANPGNYPLVRWRVEMKLGDSVNNNNCAEPLLRPIHAATSTSSRSNTQHNGTITSINQHVSADAISVYPNPATQNLNIKFNVVKAGVARISIMDVMGRVITESENDVNSNNCNVQLNISGLPTGVYFVKVVTGNSSQVVKFVKE
jgi:PKD repeat protein